MGKINVGRVILGGLLAGLVMTVSEYVLNTYVTADETSAIMQRLGLPQIGTEQIIGFVVLTFVVGIVLIWLYAAMRPRFGAGIKTAIIAAVALWVIAMISATSDVIVGITTADSLIVPGIWTLVETIVAAIVGAWVYQES
jgi:hypothetical protein